MHSVVATLTISHHQPSEGDPPSSAGVCQAIAQGGTLKRGACGGHIDHAPPNMFLFVFTSCVAARHG